MMQLTIGFVFQKTNCLDKVPNVEQKPIPNKSPVKVIYLCYLNKDNFKIKMNRCRNNGRDSTKY